MSESSQALAVCATGAAGAGPRLKIGSLDPRAYTAPAIFAELAKKTLGIMNPQR